MQQGTVTVVGTAVTDVRHAVTRDGQTFARFRAAVRPRRFDRVSGQWIDQEPSFVSVVCWRMLAENVVASIAKGDPVVASGRLRVREWRAGERQGIDVEVEAVSVGHDLSRGVTRFSRSGPKSSGERNDVQRTPAGGPPHNDPVAVAVSVEEPGMQSGGEGPPIRAA